jgi:uncharacterized membrane protein YheB (UPF0754 family)
MNEFLEFYETHRDTIAIVSIPFMCGFVGWMTNVVALKMTFYPLKFWGIPPYLGWQGIIPRKAPKMAAKSTEMLTERLISIEKLMDNVEASVLSRKMRPVVDEIAEEFVEKIGTSTNESFYKSLPKMIKDSIVQQTSKFLRPVFDQTMHDIKVKVLKAFDVKSHVVKNLTGRNVKLLVEIFQSVGAPEFKFIERSGLYFGFLLGLGQMGIWYYYNEKWTLPVIGVIVGYVTNWLAIKMIFRPLREKKYLFFTYQGLFLKRQDKVSKGYANMIATRILSPRKIINTILFGKDSRNTFQVVRQNLEEALQKIENTAGPAINLMGRHRYDQIKDFAEERVYQTVPRSVRRIESYLGEAMSLEETLYQKMCELSPEEFETVLRTAFQEDEIILILVGAFLGFCVGLFQAMVVV